MITVRKLLEGKSGCIWTIGPGQTVYDGLQLMADRDIGALLVVNSDNELVGVFSERDYARKVILKGKSSRISTIGELMTQVVYCVTPEQTIGECMALMTEKRIRHLPVVEQGRLTGVVTIGDVVKTIISEQEVTIKDLENYITGGSYEPVAVGARSC